MIPYDEMSDRSLPWHTTFIGQVMHNYWLYAILDSVIVANPQIRSIIEIGTGNGALSAYFGMWGLHRKFDVVTMDIERRHNSDLLKRLDVFFYEMDCFSDAASELITSTVNGQPTLLFCDGGCKRNEFRRYAPQMPAGSIVCAHDYTGEFDHEIDAADVPGVEKYMPERWNEMNAQVAIYKRV
jgi:cephalosporin hydroxylase